LRSAFLRAPLTALGAIVEAAGRETRRRMTLARTGACSRRLIRRSIAQRL
jgi:hypothetical protein